MKKSNVQKMHFSHSDKPIKFYNRLFESDFDKLFKQTSEKEFL